ncbi:peptidase S8/S53 domain-containing protein [Syncephalis plumigaleata]|nr:peptidase S8/S53 domain-containing protein [Syncephalis plumigaleata]
MLSNLLTTSSALSVIAHSIPASMGGTQSVSHIYPIANHVPSTLLRRQLRESSSEDSRQNNDDGNYTGRGIKIGIVDGGIDYRHPALGGCFGPGCKVAYGYDFVGSDYNGENTPVEDEDPLDDCDGHGTHVAGIIAARSNRGTGVAPDATLGAYRVFGCVGGASSQVIMKGLDRAAENGMDIINLSIGTRQFFDTYDDAMKVQELVKRGIIVVAAAGNNGGSHLGGVASPATAPGAIAVASLDVHEVVTYHFSIGNSKTKFYYISGSHVTVPSDAPKVVMRIKSGDSKGCEPLEKQYRGVFVLLKRGGCLAEQKAVNAQEGGAAGVIVVHDKSELEYFEVDRRKIHIPVLLITDKQGDQLEELMGKSKQDDRANVRWYNTPTMMSYPKPGFASFFSSYGPSNNILSTKPDISWNGNQILSTYINGGYAILPGTSMATPGITGLAALALQKYGGSIHANKDRLRFTATTLTWPKWQAANDIGGPRTIPIAYCGAGLARANATNEPGWGTEPQAITFKPTRLEGGYVHKVQVTLTGTIPAGTITFRHRPSATVSDWGAIGELDNDVISKKVVDAKMTPERLTVDGGSSQDNNNINTLRREVFTVELNIPVWRENRLWVVSGMIEVIHQDANTKTTMIRNVPYQTVVGTGRHIDVLVRNGEFPRIENIDKDNKLIPEKSDGTPLTGNYRIRLRFYLHLPSELVFAVFEDAKTRVRHGVAQGFIGTNLSRSPDDKSYAYENIWTGQVVPMQKFGRPQGRYQPLPRGTYRVLFFALRPFGNKFDERDYDSWFSAKEIIIKEDSIKDLPRDRSQNDMAQKTEFSTGERASQMGHRI